MKIDPNAAAFGHGAENGHCCGLPIRAELAARFMAAHIMTLSSKVTNDAISNCAERHKMSVTTYLAQMGIEDADALIAELNKE